MAIRSLATQESEFEKVCSDIDTEPRNTGFETLLKTCESLVY